MKIERIEQQAKDMLKPHITITFECRDQQELDEQYRLVSYIMHSGLSAVVAGYRTE